ncbi:Stk1 family PASTA domain-containing Ser/Thr kinase [Lacticaseibacillus baoqingensis]|uniref:non-specific serine/threonine protein kinase n=1 Tax=Lacticaseibacillus baoqingensis TaxID=2486013 RepID=A0ABW4E357_9LACO|nr:Stk1 family PASTA domain-containing Ser/Thr kinase [Lacticaseibacillus baoqingensis]
MIEPGFTLNERYQLKQTLGEGGMANVYLAHDLILDRDVAVKVLRLDLQNDPDAARRFQREAMATSELVHPNIVSIYDVGESHGQQYLVMEYVPGSDLKKYIVEHFPIPYQRVIEIMGQILSAVQVAHDHHIIHRDLKPQNILIDRDGNAKISDFGIAVALSDNSMTQTNSLLGSVHYLSPEQARGGMPTRQSDIYALGIILFEMLTGTVPFEGDSAVSIALKHFQEAMPSVRDFDPRIPQALENVVLKATTKDPAERYTSADAMNSDLKTALSAKRAHEPKFEPTGDDLDETKILPNLSADAAKVAPAQAQAVSSDQTKKPQRLAGLKKRWPFIAAAIAAGLIVIALVLAFSGGKADVQIPDLRGMSTAQATTALKNADLKLGKVSQAYSDSVAKSRIIASDPRRDTSVKSGSQVAVTLSRGPKRFTMADYTGEPYADVAKDLRKKGFTVRSVKTSSETVAKGKILKQDVAKGKKVVPMDTTIIFTVSSGTSTFSLQNLVGTSLVWAQTYANEVGLTITVTDAYSNSVASGEIISQSPQAGTQVSRGDTVAVVLSKGDQPQSSSSQPDADSDSGADHESAGLTVPDVVGQAQSAAEGALNAAGLSPQVVTQGSQSVPAGTVISQTPSGNSNAKSGDAVTIVVSSGPAAASSSASSSSASSNH